MKLSIVSTLYQSSPYIQAFVDRVRASAAKITDDFEIILVNDGSPDDSLEKAIAIHRDDPRVTVVDLSRNFGHHRAIMTGLSYARGDRVFLIDCDLEEEPELLERFQDEFAKQDCDVVYGYMAERKGGIFERVSGHIFYWLLDFLTSYSFPRNVIMARLMSRRYVNSLLLHREREIFLGGLCYITGYAQIGVPVKKHSKGSTTYTFRRKAAMLVNSVSSFSDKPLILICYIGATISLISTVAIILVIVNRVLFSIPAGWTSLLASIWFLGGLSILFMGVIGIYLSKVFIETKGRPYTIVREIYGASEVCANGEERRGLRALPARAEGAQPD